MAEKAGISIVANERYARTDQSTTGQVLKLMAAKPDAVLIAAVGGPAVLPQAMLFDQGYKGRVYQTHAVATEDFIKLGREKVEGTVLAAGPMLVIDEIPDSNPTKKVAQNYIAAYEKQFGTRPATFGANTWDGGLLIERALPAALKAGSQGRKRLQRVATAPKRKRGRWNAGRFQHVRQRRQRHGRPRARHGDRQGRGVPVASRVTTDNECGATADPERTGSADVQPVIQLIGIPRRREGSAVRRREKLPTPLPSASHCVSAGTGIGAGIVPASPVRVAAGRRRRASRRFHTCEPAASGGSARRGMRARTKGWVPAWPAALPLRRGRTAASWHWPTCHGSRRPQLRWSPMRLWRANIAATQIGVRAHPVGFARQHTLC